MHETTSIEPRWRWLPGGLVGALVLVAGIGAWPGSAVGASPAAAVPEGAGASRGVPGVARLASGPNAPVVCDAVWHDAARDRDVPVRIRIPAGEQKVPVILFSHGLGGSLDAGTTWAEAWVRAGFAVIHLQHHGSDRELYRGMVRPAEILRALRSGMTAQQLVARAGDVHFVLDELARRRREGRCDLTRIDLTRVGMSGHSFGAHTTQAVAGQSYPGTGPALRDDRIRAAVAFSPSPPTGSDDVARAAFASITIPFLSITGTEDAVPVLTRITPEQRTVPYRDMPPGGKYLLVLAGAGHMAFSGNVRGGGGAGAREGRPGFLSRRGSAATAHVDRAVIAATVAFWKATLLGDEEARAYLDGSDFRRLLGSGDRFEWK